MAGVPYLPAEQLVQLLRSDATLLVVDVRDADRAGGHIKGSKNVTAANLKSNVQRYVQEWRHFDKIVFHCMFSQVRGPSCALAFQRAAQATQPTDNSSSPQVYILQDGFIGFSKLHTSNTDLFEDFDTNTYGPGSVYD